MKVIYFDTFAGASGDMLLGALVDSGLKIEKLEDELKKLNLPGWSISAEKQTRKGISGTKVTVKTEETHHHRGLNTIIEIIDRSGLSEKVKSDAKAVFHNLGKVEAKIHNKSVDEIHFHEVGAVDSIIDIVGFVLGIESLGIDKVYCSKIHIGSGTIDCAHGKLPVPAPATLELLKGLPAYSTGIESELVTPTGAAILKSLSSGFGKMPEMAVAGTGYGFGTKELPIANFLRAAIGESDILNESDQIVLVETNIDDMNPEFYDYVFERLFSAGAKDVFMNQVIMKKNRPGIVLSVICAEPDINKLSEIIFSETTTYGLRITPAKMRMVLNRSLETVSTEWGDIRVKVRDLDGRKYYSPEYEDCKRLAEKRGVPVQTVFDAAKKYSRD